MKLLKKLFSLKRNKESEFVTKEDIKIKGYSILFFQIGLVASILVATFVINLDYETVPVKAYEPKVQEERKIFNDFIVYSPPQAVVVEQKPVVKRKVAEVIKVIDNMVSEPAADKPITVDPVEIFTDKPIVVIPQSKDPEPDTLYNVMAVEMVPVFPGCESLSNNDKRRDCMADQIANIVRRKFNRDLASDLGLKGIQRIHVSFTVSETGLVSDIRVRSPHPKLDKEAERVAGLIPKMAPGKMGGKNVSVSYNLPIIFDIE